MEGCEWKGVVSALKNFAFKKCKITAEKKMGEFCLTSRIFLVSVLLSALVKRCFVSHMRDFFLYIIGKSAVYQTGELLVSKIINL